MANEATVTVSLTISNQALQYRSFPTGFSADVIGTKGPTPGAVSITTAGTDISLAELTTPALCKFTNLDATNYVEWGIWNGTTFFPLGEILPSEIYLIRLSRNLLSGGNSLRFKANTATVNALIEAFEA